jgi:hypothetical protein
LFQRDWFEHGLENRCALDPDHAQGDVRGGAVLGEAARQARRQGLASSQGRTIASGKTAVKAT